MQNWQPESGDVNCTLPEDYADAAKVCEQLEIEFATVNFVTEYWELVFRHCLDEYAIGRTPNPDIWCNREIKFRAFLDYALNLGADFIATGHYAQIERANSQVKLLRGLDENKDQSYFLHLLNQEQLTKTIFPLGKMHKTEVRTLAKKLNLVNYAKKGSTGICFIGERKFKPFLENYLLTRPGKIVDRSEKILGKHDGLMFYTLGQRQGLGIGGIKNGDEAPWYVVAKDFEHNYLIVSQNKQDPAIWNDSLQCSKPHWISGSAPIFPLKCAAKVRYRATDAACTVTASHGGGLNVKFAEPEWAPTPGQAIVFYDGMECLGGATIEMVGAN